MKINLFLTSLLFLLNTVFGANYPDQEYVLRTGDMASKIESAYNIVLSADEKVFELKDGATQGYLILAPDTSDQPFNEGLPSWNGMVTDDNTSFLIQMRFPYGSGWSDWLTVGYWEKYIWGAYGATSFPGGYVDIDYVKLNNYQSRFQFRINMLRQNAGLPSPTLHKLSFFVSDSRTTANADFDAILNDKPAQIFIPTDFIYQYGVDDEIGPSICSPTTVSMILKSYDIEVDSLDFAVDTYDPYHGIYGVWPRVVQNASEKGLDGAVTRYRTWSETREVLANGGRIAMSVSYPLYAGHLLMLAGFTSDGRPIVHDPAKRDGYGKVYNKSDLSHSWFDKGGIAYTFFPADSQANAIEDVYLVSNLPDNFELKQNYPNPFNSSTRISFELSDYAQVRIDAFDASGRHVAEIYNEPTAPGSHVVAWNANELSSGTYFIRFSNGQTTKMLKAVLMK